MIAFQTLWDQFPDADALKAKCFNKNSKGDASFDNYCAISMSECFIRSDIPLETCTGVRCWSHAGAKHVLRAEDMAKWLLTKPPKGFGKREIVNPTSFQNHLGGRTGVVFFKDYWTRGNERFENRSGDHIDLWNRDRITGSGMFVRSIIELLGLVSDLNKSKTVWFWEVK